MALENPIKYQRDGKTDKTVTFQLICLCLIVFAIEKFQFFASQYENC